MTSSRQVKLADIREHPENHKHSFAELIECCSMFGAIDTGLMDAHQAAVARTNGGRCDVVTGACSCGAWHDA